MTQSQNVQVAKLNQMEKPHKLDWEVKFFYAVDPKNHAS